MIKVAYKYLPSSRKGVPQIALINIWPNSILVHDCKNMPVILLQGSVCWSVMHEHYTHAVSTQPLFLYVLWEEAGIYLEKTHANTGRTSRLHTESQTGIQTTVLLWGSSANHCTIVLPPDVIKRVWLQILNAVHLVHLDINAAASWHCVNLPQSFIFDQMSSKHKTIRGVSFLHIQLGQLSSTCSVQTIEAMLPTAERHGRARVKDTPRGAPRRGRPSIKWLWRVDVITRYANKSLSYMNGIMTLGGVWPCWPSESIIADRRQRSQQLLRPRLITGRNMTRCRCACRKRFIWRALSANSVSGH